VNDEEIRKILEGTRTIAVVGLSNDPAKASHGVARYLLSQGYELMPVNPTSPEVLGMRSYPDLTALGKPVDVVQIFRRPKDVPPVIDDAIAIGVKVVWMQPGAENEDAAETAEAAGVTAVVGHCMRAVHRALHERPGHR